MRLRWIALLFVLLLNSGQAAEPDDRLASALKDLSKAGVKTDGPGLLEFFRQRTLTDQKVQQIGLLIKQLNDDLFAIREQATRDLITLGTPARAALELAARDPDPEIATRARRCLDALPTGATIELVGAALRVLALIPEKPEGAVAVLLAYLPSVVDEAVEEEIAAVLGELGVRNGKVDPALVAAVKDQLPARRLAAAAALARAGAQERGLIHPLLQDPAPRVRLFAAVALAQGKDPAAVPALISMLDTAPPVMALQAEDLLCRIAGEQGPAVVLAVNNPASRGPCRAAWEAWWQANAAKVDLSKLDRAPPYLGLNLICDCDVGQASVGQVWECSADGKVRWQIGDVRNPADIQLLPNGRLLIAECQGLVITERDRQGKIYWQHKVQGYPVSCQRLDNGNTFIATYTELLEVARDGKIVYSHKRPNSIYCAQKLANDRILFVTSTNQVVEIDTSGKETRTVQVGNTSGWAGVEILPSGRLLVALYSADKVVEVDNQGKELWELPVQKPAWATRLNNGNTLVASPDGHFIAEYDRSCKKVWEQATHGRPFRVRRR